MNKIVFVWAAVFSAIGLSILLYKHSQLGFPLLPDTSSKLWTVEANVLFEAEGKPVKVELRIPSETASHQIIEENMIGPRYGTTIKSDTRGRKGTWTKQLATGKQRLFYRAIVKERVRDDLPKAAVERSVKELQNEISYMAAETLIMEVRSRSADDESFVLELMKQFNGYETNENLQAILGIEAGQSELARTMVALLNIEGIPANTVTGFELVSERADVPLIIWVEVFYNQKWNLFKPDGTPLSKADNHLLWWRGTSDPIEIKGGKFKDLRFSVYEDQSPQLVDAIKNLREQNPLFYKLSLYNLPVHTQAVYKVLLLLPIGALVVVFLRTVIGIFSFGNFIPVLIAMSFRETQLFWGLVLFIVVTGIGLIARLMLERLSLLTSARLGIVVSAVILGMAFLSVILEELNLAQGLSVALFPMVVLTMIIERMSIVWEEVGPAQSVRQGLQTLLIATLVYAVISVDQIRFMIFTYPETLLIVIAAIMLLGRYTGYRLTELFRFKSLAK